MSNGTQRERRTGMKDRRVAPFDRRQFISVSWPFNQNRRLAGEDRRQGPGDRRQTPTTQPA
jgi:hypothetical protein